MSGPAGVDLRGGHAPGGAGEPVGTATSLGTSARRGAAAHPGTASRRLGGSDCERLRDGPLAQPVNTLTSAAYVAAAGTLVARARPVAPGRRIGVATYSCVLALVGIGSIAYHGPQPPGAKALHDWPIVALVASAALIQAVRGARGTALAPGATRGRVGSVVALTALAGLSYLGGRTGAPTCDPESPIQLHGGWQGWPPAPGGALHGAPRLP